MQLQTTHKDPVFATVTAQTQGREEHEEVRTDGGDLHVELVIILIIILNKHLPFLKLHRTHFVAKKKCGVNNLCLKPFSLLFHSLTS